MVDGNNGNFDPGNGSLPDISYQKEKEKYGITILGLPKFREGALVSKAILTGDLNEADKYVPLVSQQMIQMHMQNVNNFEIANRTVDLGGGSFIDCNRNFTEDTAHVFINPNQTATETEVVVVEDEGS